MVSKRHDSDLDGVEEYGTLRSIIYFILGIVGLAIGGRWIVNGAIEIAGFFGMSESLMGLTIVAIGTSLPELAASAVATYKGRTSLAIGNVVGSNIFNVLLVLGINAIINNVQYNAELNFDLFVAIISIVLLFLFVVLSKKKILVKWQGIVFITLYIGYIVFLVYRG